MVYTGVVSTLAESCESRERNSHKSPYRKLKNSGETGSSSHDRGKYTNTMVA